MGRDSSGPCTLNQRLSTQLPNVFALVYFQIVLWEFGSFVIIARPD